MLAFGMAVFLNISVFVAGNEVLEPHVRGLGRYARNQTGFGLHPIFKVTTGDSVVLLIKMIGIIADLVLAWMVEGRRMEGVIFHGVNDWLGWGGYR